MRAATTSPPPTFWLRWLVVAAAVVIGFGASMVLAPGPTRQLFGLLLFASLAAWFVPDTTYSLASGFWPNAVLNAGFVLHFAPPLLATRGR